MIGSKSSIKSKKWLLVVLAVLAMVGGGSFAVATINDPNNKVPILIGDRIDSSGTVTSTSLFQWTEDPTIDIPSPFTEILAEGTQHTIVIRLAADKGDRATITINDLLCFAADDDQPARIKAEVDPGILVDVIEVDGAIEDVRITSRPNEWIVTVHECDPAAGDGEGDNEFDVDLVVLDQGVFRFSLTIEPL